MNWYIGVLKNYANFNGRARRKEYWMFMLFHIIICVVLQIISGLTMSVDPYTGQPNVGIGFWLLCLYLLATLLPQIALTTRRLHDTDRSGWWQLLYLIPVAGLVVFVFTVLEGTQGDNRFGEDPKE